MLENCMTLIMTKPVLFFSSVRLILLLESSKDYCLNFLFIRFFFSLQKMIKERRKEKKAGIVREKKDLLDVLMDMYDQETNSVMDDEELRSQVQKLHILNYHFNNNKF